MKKEEKEALIKISISDFNHQMLFTEFVFRGIQHTYYKTKDKDIEFRLNKDEIEKLITSIKRQLIIAEYLQVNRKKIWDAELQVKQIKKSYATANSTSNIVNIFEQAPATDYEPTEEEKSLINKAFENE